MMTIQTGDSDEVNIPANGYIDVTITFQTVFRGLPVISFDTGVSGYDFTPILRRIGNDYAIIRLKNNTESTIPSQKVRWQAIGIIT